MDIVDGFVGTAHKIHSLDNVMTMLPDLRVHFDRLSMWFEPIEVCLPSTLMGLVLITTTQLQNAVNSIRRTHAIATASAPPGCSHTVSSRVRRSPLDLRTRTACRSPTASTSASMRRAVGWCTCLAHVLFLTSSRKT